jgi:hypothetical protein
MRRDGRRPCGVSWRGSRDVVRCSAQALIHGHPEQDPGFPAHDLRRRSGSLTGLERRRARRRGPRPQLRRGLALAPLHVSRNAIMGKAGREMELRTTRVRAVLVAVSDRLPAWSVRHEAGDGDDGAATSPRSRLRVRFGESPSWVSRSKSACPMVAKPPLASGTRRRLSPSRVVNGMRAPKDVGVPRMLQRSVSVRALSFRAARASRGTLRGASWGKRSGSSLDHSAGLSQRSRPTTGACAAAAIFAATATCCTRMATPCPKGPVEMAHPQ